MPVFCLKAVDIESNGTWIRKGDKIGQFRIMEVMPEIEFEEVESFGNSIFDASFKNSAKPLPRQALRPFTFQLINFIKISPCCYILNQRTICIFQHCRWARKAAR